MRHDLLSMDFEELSAFIAALELPKYRAAQMFEWFHRHTASFDANFFKQMNNLPKSLIRTLEETCITSYCTTTEIKSSASSETKKYLFALSDGVLIESVQMNYSFGDSVCISTQAGCKMGCSFCASGAGGFIRNLTAGEMLAQVHTVRKNILGKLSGIVLMGCGEPLDNFEQTIKFLKIIADPKSLGISMRSITLSTCGLVPEIRKLADMCLKINLAISLHAPNDRLRKAIMPIANVYSIRELMDVCRYYTERTARRITFEYALIAGTNDQPSHAHELIKLLSGMLCHVNLIPINSIAEEDTIKRSDLQHFAKILNKNHIPTTIRRTIGADINAACGQLRARPWGSGATRNA